MKHCSQCNFLKQDSDFYFLEKRKRLSSKCRKCSNTNNYSYRKKKYTESWFSRRILSLQRGAQRRGIEFKITREELIYLLRQKICFYCNSYSEQISIDRVDNRLGYVPSNCVACCLQDNKRKRDLTLEEIEMFYLKTREWKR